MYPGFEGLYLHDRQPSFWVYGRYELEETCQILFKELRDTRINERLWLRNKIQQSTEEERAWSRNGVENALEQDWLCLGKAAFHMANHDPNCLCKDTDRSIRDIADGVAALCLNLEVLSMGAKSSQDPVDEIIFPHEHGLQYLYGHLEFGQAAWKYVEMAEAAAKKSKHKTKSEPIIKSLQYLRKALKDMYTSAMHVAVSYTSILQDRGVENVLAQVRWGPTGAALRQIMTDEEQRQYAQEYVSAAADSLQGVCKVQFGKQ